MSDMVRQAWRKYLLQLQLHPLRTKAITSGVLIGGSDAIAQKISGVKKLQFRRLLLLMLFGFAYSGPFGHFLHKLMEIIFKGKKGKATVAKKVILEQLTSSPWNNMFFMMYYGLVVEGIPWVLVKSKLRKDYPSVQLTAWKGNLSESKSKICCNQEGVDYANLFLPVLFICNQEDIDYLISKVSNICDSPSKMTPNFHRIDKKQWAKI
ncbi:Peroxisomal membrane protein [Tripterygium wilfordii]|uniref:Peroxisomal membrane protein n=1 Tax=Tripterygium wilfordii TaxID=458696 RepID=A0A7J7CWV4_TRIWF|nr:Peroxisomal membrane protein [Tripterygium wilfordii]